MCRVMWSALGGPVPAQAFPPLRGCAVTALLTGLGTDRKGANIRPDRRVKRVTGHGQWYARFESLGPTGAKPQKALSRRPGYEPDSE